MGGVLVHEWIATHGGSEQVLDRFAALFTDADIRCLWDETGGKRYPDREVHESWLARSPLRTRRALAVPLMPSTWANAPAEGYEWMLASSHAFAHHAFANTAPPDMTRIAYVHTPARYVWEPTLDARGATPWARAGGKALQPVDKRRALSLDVIIANSDFVRERIQRCWGRDDAVVVYPPVNVAHIQSQRDWANVLSEADAGELAQLPDTFVLAASRFIPYKRLEAAITAGEASDLPVVIAGAGPLEESLRKAAEASAVPVHVVTAPSTPLLYALYQRALVLVFVAIEDFGIVPVEAMAAGCPVVAINEGGAAESVGLLEGGVLVDGVSSSSLAEAVHGASSIDRGELARRARSFDTPVFDTKIEAVVAAALTATTP
jgi:glycosyltransferase involved in cell wall biosynthesis